MDLLANSPNNSSKITEVFADNLRAEFSKIRHLVGDFPFVAVDTEFPGVVAKPIGEYKSLTDFHYQSLRVNVNLLKVIQIGLSFFDADGRAPEPCSTWQFNFKFSLNDDMYAEDSVKMLANSGINFAKLQLSGIQHVDFAELLISSGLLLDEDVKWLSFDSRYDFGYLLKMLTNTQLPEEDNEFLDLLKTYFPVVYDLKHVVKFCANLPTRSAGLQELADQLRVARIGPQHQAGSDSLLTGLTYFNMKRFYLDERPPADDFLYRGIIYGLDGCQDDSSRSSAVSSPANVMFNKSPSKIASPKPNIVTTSVVESESKFGVIENGAADEADVYSRELCRKCSVGNGVVVILDEEEKSSENICPVSFY